MKPTEADHIMELLNGMKSNDYYAMALLWRYSSPNGLMIAKILLKNFAKRRVERELSRGVIQQITGTSTSQPAA